MRPVPIPKEMVPQDVEHKVIVVGPPSSKSILDDDAPLPVEALILEDGYHIRVALDEVDLESLQSRPYLWLVFQSTQVPVFWIGSELEALNGGRRPDA